MTKEGKIIVDGVVASCYAGFDHDLAHFTMAPMQYFADVLEWTFEMTLGIQSLSVLQENLADLFWQGNFLD